MGSTRATEAVKKLTETQSTKGMFTVRRTYGREVEIRVPPPRGVRLPSGGLTRDRSGLPSRTGA
jgi:hypothetical protein